MGALRQKYNLWLSGNDVGSERVGILVKEKVCGNVVEVRRKSDRVMAILLPLGGEVIRITCTYELRWEPCAVGKL